MIITVNKTTKKTTKKTSKKTSIKSLKSCYVEYHSFYLVLTGLKLNSQNKKTGAMIQSYFIDKETINHATVFGSKCGQCPMLEKCYVSRDKLTVRRLLKEGNYTQVSFNTMLELIKDKPIRLGTYGDPSVLPLSDLEAICKSASMHTGYTHFFNTIPTQYSRFLMASVESYTQELFAQSLGYRTFRVLLKGYTEYETSDHIIECVNDTHGLTCLECGLCNGNQKGKVKNIYINEH